MGRPHPTWITLAALMLPGCGEDLGERSVGAQADACQSCHADVTKQHLASRHARSRVSPVFLALRERAEADLGTATRMFCDGCHVPPEATSEGLSCVSCHAAVGNEGTENGQLVLDLEGPVRGPTGHAANAPHAVEQSSFLKSSDLCGTCHDANGPVGFVETPFLAWQSAPAAKLGVTCADCHMQDEPGLPSAGGQRSHRVVGFDDVSLEDESDLGAKLGARVLSLELTVTAETSSSPQVDVTVHHTGTGHPFPTGATFLRELWISLEIEDEHGSRWFQSGVAGPDEMLMSDDGSVRWLSTRTVKSGSEVPSPTEAGRLVRHGISPEQSVRESFSTSLPDGPWTARACVRLRRYRPDMLDALGLSRQEAGPVIDVTCQERSFD